LNNLACTSWYHQKALDKIVTIPEKTKEKELASKDSEYIVSYFKEAIEKLESL
jgi:hypothetical protein